MLVDTCIIRWCCFLRIRAGSRAIISVLSAGLRPPNSDCTMRIVGEILIGGGVDGA